MQVLKQKHKLASTRPTDCIVVDYTRDRTASEERVNYVDPAMLP